MIKLSEEDNRKLRELHIRAQNTPVVSMTGSADADWSRLAWNVVSQFQQELGAKYGYDWQTHAITHDGKVLTLEEAEKYKNKNKELQDGTKN